DDDDDEEGYNSLNNNIISKLPLYSAVTPTEPIDSLSMGDEHLNTIPITESDEFIKSRVENLVPNPSESEGENECDVPAGFTTFSNVLFDDDYDFDSSDDQLLSDEDVREKIYSNPLFDEEIIPMEIDQHSLNDESDLIESMPNHDSSVIISLKIDSLFDEFAGELTLLKSFPPGNDKTDCHPEKEIRLTKRLLYDNSSPRPPEEIVSDNSNADIESFSPSPIPNEDNGNTRTLNIKMMGDVSDQKRLLYDNSSPRPPEEFNSKNSNAEIESFSPSPIPNKDSDSFMEEIDLFLTPEDPMPSSIEDDEDSEGDILFLERLLHDDPIPLPDIPDFSYEVRTFLPFFTYPVTSPVLLSSRSKDKIFDPCITINHLYFKPGLSHRHGAFKKFNTHRSHLNEWPMIINGKNTPLLDVTLIPGNLKTLAKGFYPPSLNFLSSIGNHVS
nr:hypothetical protein [Tanacetum cinerariifolium]